MEARFVLLKSLLTQAGIEPERVHLQWASAAEGDVFSEGVTMMVERIKLLGPNPVRRGT
jgi:F420-non-reducing hydrogenase iron-sulfur subunit